jgi:hypothetical protein
VTKSPAGFVAVNIMYISDAFEKEEDGGRVVALNVKGTILALAP